MLDLLNLASHANIKSTQALYTLGGNESLGREIEKEKDEPAIYKCLTSTDRGDEAVRKKRRRRRGEYGGQKEKW